MTLRSSLFAALALGTVLVASAAGDRRLVIKGSDTLGAKLVPQWAEAFKITHPAVTFEIAAEGSTTGLAAITDGTADIGMSSREARPTEVSAARARGVTMTRTVVSYDAMAVIVNEANPVREMTVRQVEQVFTGDVADWSAVGGAPGAISIYTRSTASGTYQDWKNLAMNRRDYASGSQKMAGNEQIAAEVGRNAAGIGYVGLAYTGAPGVRVVAIIDRQGRTSLPSIEAVHTGLYPYARPNFFYTDGEPKGIGAQFIAFATGEEGQAIALKAGFVPIAAARR